MGRLTGEAEGTVTSDLVDFVHASMGETRFTEWLIPLELTGEYENLTESGKAPVVVK